MGEGRTIHDRIKLFRKASGFKTATEAARAQGWTVSTYLGYENGDREPGKEMLQNISKAFGVGLHYLLMGEGIIQGSSEPDYAWIVGDVGEDGELLRETLAPEGFIKAESFIPFIDDVMWLRVTSLSLWPRYDRQDIIGCFRVGQSVDKFKSGAEYIVRLKDGRRLVRKVRPSEKAGLFTLEIHNAPPCADVEIEWFSEVIAVMRASNWSPGIDTQTARGERRAMMARAAESGLFGEET